MGPGIRNLFALMVYCLVFSFLFVIIYPMYFEEQRRLQPGVEPRAERERPRDRGLGKNANKASLALSVAGVDPVHGPGRGGGGQRSLQAELPARRTTEQPTLPSRSLREPRRPIAQDCPRVPLPLQKYIPASHSVPLTDKEKVLAMCQQEDVMPIEDFFSETMIATLTKIGEGAFADVFGCQGDDWSKMALKVTPVDGKFKYNDEEQNTMKNVQPELVVSLELSLLGSESNRLNKSVPHYTLNFMQFYRVGLCQGKFPPYLLDAWDDYDFRKKSDNDRPDVFPDHQMYIIYAAENAGVQLGSYVYHSFEEALSILQQVSGTVAVGEEALQFEHRDMHRGNILVRRTHEEEVYIRLDGKDYHIKTYGVRATIVDYTLSRVRQGNCNTYQDLNNYPWLFKGKGDIQFDVYRDMRNATRSHWDKFEPYTNILWIRYLATKCSIKGKLKHISTSSWKRKFEPYLKVIANYHKTKDLFINVFAPGVRMTTSTASRLHH